ncbi:MAG: YggT family protein [Proteobacteria bacterium]|nr:YggT family protein [Pseudomonadota bacterium]
MTGSPLSDAGIFLVNTVFGLYILLVALRFLLQCVRADFYNPISQFLITFTNPPLRILRRFIPGFAGIDWPSLLLMLALQSLELVITGLLGPGQIPALPGLLVLSIAALLKLFIYIFFFAIFIRIIISWVNPGAYNPMTVILHRLTDPLLLPARRLIPPISGLDLSPMVVIIALQLMIILFIKPLTYLGYSLSGYLF